MAEKPILFNGEMVRAILDRCKTQTRRPVVPQPAGGVRHSPFVASGLEDGHGREIRPAYYPGDTLWVREGIERRHGILTGTLDGLSGALYLATRTAVMGNGPAGRYVNGRALVDWQWKRYVLPGIHMPRWASRITLEVSDVRGQRVQDITEEDAIAEAAYRWLSAKSGRASDIAQDAAIRWTKRLNPDAREVSDRGLFVAMWDSLYTKRGLGGEANPWVWVYTFKVVTP